jgi:hypothetical protein
VRGLADAVVRGDAAGLGRSAAIVTGLAYATAGYVVGLRRLPRDTRPPPTGPARLSHQPEGVA